MRRTTLLATAALAVGALPALASTAHADTVTKVSTTVQIRCAFTMLSQDADWYFPSGTPKGLVWLQHGFARSNTNMTDLATKYSAQGYLVFAPTLPTANIYGCTLENIGNNTDFLNNVADLFGKASDPTDKLGTSFAKAKALAGRSGLTLPTNVVFSGHSAGGEAVSYVANRVRTTYPSAFTGLRGLVLLDPVKSVIGSNLATGLNGLNAAGTKVLTISGPGSTCNSSGTGTTEVQSDIHQPFVGVRLVNGEHTDAEGASTDAVGTLACGTPQAVNVAALQNLAVTWVSDDFAGTTTASSYPGGSYYQSQVTAGVISTLAGAS